MMNKKFEKSKAHQTPISITLGIRREDILNPIMYKQEHLIYSL